MKKMISVIAPLYNEESLIWAYCNEVFKVFSSIQEQYNLELVLIDDGSSDNTLRKMQEVKDSNPQSVTTIQLSRNFGLEAALQSGLCVAKGDAVVVMDADLQDPPSVILEMIKKWEMGADIVTASRRARPNDSFFKKLTASMFYKVMDVFSGRLKLEKEAANFRLLSRDAVTKLNNFPEVNRVFRVLVPFIGMKTAVVEYDRDKRFAGETKYNLKSMVRYALDSITGISIEPLRKIPLTIGISLITMILMIFGAVLESGLNQVIYIALLVISLFFTLLFVVLSIIAEYLGQVYVEVKNRPDSITYKVSSCGEKND